MNKLFLSFGALGVFILGFVAAVLFDFARPPEFIEGPVAAKKQYTVYDPSIPYDVRMESKIGAARDDIRKYIREKGCSVTGGALRDVIVVMSSDGMLTYAMRYMDPLEVDTFDNLMSFLTGLPDNDIIVLKEYLQKSFVNSIAKNKYVLKFPELCS